MTLIAFVKLFAEFRGPSWDGWRAILARITPGVREVYGVIGRGAGKSRIAALVACWKASQAYRLAPGERVYVGVGAPDRKQGVLTLRYIVGLLHSVPSLSRLIVSETGDSVELSNGVIIEVVTASTSGPRGRAYALWIQEEAAFLPTDDSVNPDVEILRAVRPALARVPGSLLVVISSPYARKGVLWAAWQKYHDQPDGEVVFVQAATLDLNPTFDAAAVATAYVEDPASAAAEYGAQFRIDVEQFVSRDAVDAVVVPGRYELAYVAGATYRGFLDFAGGAIGGDSAVLGIAHAEARQQGRTVAVLDLLRERQPPFSPETVCAEFAGTLKAYGVRQAVADRWAGQFPVEQMYKHGIIVEPSEHPKSDIYRDLLPLVNSGGCELLDVPRLRGQLVGLERRTARGGRDSIDHAPSAKDDVINAAAGCLVLAALAPARTVFAALSPAEYMGRGRMSSGMTLAEKSTHLAAQARTEWQDKYFR